MSRSKSRGGVSVGHDAFLDIVANLVGILIILVVVLGSQSQQVMRDALQQQQVDETDRAAGEADVKRLASAATRAASAQRDSIRLEHTIRTLDQRIVREEERRAVLLALLEQAEAAWEQQLESLQRDRDSSARMAAEATRLRKQLDQLGGDRQRLENEKPPVVAISHLPTPMAKTVFGEELYLRLKDNRLSVIPFEDLAEEIGRDFRRTSMGGRSGVSDSAVGPVRGYVARYVMNRSNQLVNQGGSIARMTRARVVVAAFEPLEEPHGTPIEAVLANDDWLDIELMPYSPETTTVTVAVYPDSYAAFRRLKEKIYAKGFATAARPIENGRPIYVNFAGGGSRSAAQ